MKIELQSKINYYSASVTEAKRKSAEAPAMQKTSGNFDGIKIQSGQMPSQEAQFASAVSSRLSMELRKPVSSAQILDLQQQIDEGRYQVDVNAIADSIMLC